LAVVVDRRIGGIVERVVVRIVVPNFPNDSLTVDISNIFDFNRDKKVNAADEYLARTNSGASLTILTISAASAAEESSTTEEAAAVAETAELSALAAETPSISDIVQKTVSLPVEDADNVSTATDALQTSKESTPAEIASTSASVLDTSSAPVADTVPTLADTAQSQPELSPTAQSMHAMETTSEIVSATAADEPKTSSAVVSTATSTIIESEMPVARPPKGSIPHERASMPNFTASAHAEVFASVARKSKPAKPTQKIESAQRWSMPEMLLTANDTPSELHKIHDLLFDDDDPCQNIKKRRFGNRLSEDDFVF
jgi:hypothetical protein